MSTTASTWCEPTRVCTYAQPRRIMDPKVCPESGHRTGFNIAPRIVEAWCIGACVDVGTCMPVRVGVDCAPRDSRAHVARARTCGFGHACDSNMHHIIAEYTGAARASACRRRPDTVADLQSDSAVRQSSGSVRVFCGAFALQRRPVKQHAVKDVSHVAGMMSLVSGPHYWCDLVDVGITRRPTARGKLFSALPLAVYTRSAPRCVDSYTRAATCLTNAAVSGWRDAHRYHIRVNTRVEADVDALAASALRSLVSSSSHDGPQVMGMRCYLQRDRLPAPTRRASVLRGGPARVGATTLTRGWREWV